MNLPLRLLYRPGINQCGLQGRAGTLALPSAMAAVFSNVGYQPANPPVAVVPLVLVEMKLPLPSP